MEIEQKDGKISFWFYRLPKNKEEEVYQKKAVLSAIEDIRKMKKTDWKLIFIFLMCFSTALGFHYYTQKVEKNPEYIEQIQIENQKIEENIEKQILDRKAEELGFQKLHENNPEIIDYINLYILPQTALYELETEKIIYKGVAISVPAVKLRDGKTVFVLKNVKYYIKD
jgi:hypothetical protein